MILLERMLVEKAILIQSPAKFYEAVPFFYMEASKFGFLDKFYVATDYQGPHDLGNDCIIKHLSKDYQFSTNMVKLLSLVKEDTFFICCEDHVFTPFNEVALWQRCWDFVNENKQVGYLRLTNNNRIELESKKDFISAIKRKDKYYVSLQPGIWKREYFEHVLKKGEDAWKFELNGAKRAKKHKKLRSYCVQKTVFHHTNFFKAGKYYRHKFAEYAIRNGMDLKSGRKIHWKGNYYRFEEYKEIYKKKNG